VEQKTKRFSGFLNGDVIFLFVCLAFSAAILIETRQLQEPSAALVPRLFGILAVIFSLLAIFYRALSFLRGYEKKKVTMGISTPRLEGVEVEGAMNLFLAIGLSVLYLILAELIGFVVGTVLIVSAYLWFAQYRRIPAVVLYSVVTSLSLYWLFYSLLKVNLPQGLIHWPWQRWLQ
jgi:hypothetical protein